MKIPLSISYKDRLVPNILVPILSQRKYGSILTIIDTGCEETILSYKDALILQIPVKGMTTTKHIQGLSGTSVGLCEYKKDLVLSFKTDEETISRIKLHNIYVSKNPNGAGVTILGTDFLKQSNLKLIYDPQGNSYLEGKE